MYQMVLVLGTLILIGISNGFIFGQSAGLLSSLQERKEGINLSDGEISFIATLLTMTCLIGYAVGAVMTEKIGRRWPFVILSTTMIINWIILYYSKTMLQFILSRIVGGISVGGLASLSIFVPSEYTPPRTRAFFLNMITTTAPALGTGLAHIIGLFLHWKHTALIGILMAVFGVMLPYFWVESPHWLASRGMFKECETAFWLVHGKTTNRERELQLLIKMEMNKLKRANETNVKSPMKKLCLAFRRKYFWKLLMISIIVTAYMAAAGKLVFTVFATIILNQITGTSNVVLFMLLVDGFMVLGSILSCYLIMKTSMRTLLFSTGFTATVLLMLFSICYYFKNGQDYFNWINVTLLAFYFIIVNAGPYPIVEAIISEIFPLDLKMYVFPIVGITLIGFFTLTLILFPYSVAAMGYHGWFLTNAVIMCFCLGSIWLTLPETKGKTLQEIETYFKTNNFDVEDILNSERRKSLI